MKTAVQGKSEWNIFNELWSNYVDYIAHTTKPLIFQHNFQRKWKSEP